MSAKLSYLFLISYTLLTTVINSMNMPMPSQRAVILLWWQENWKWWSDRDEDTSKNEDLKRLTCYSIFNFIICSNYTRCSGPWHGGWSKAAGTDNEQEARELNMFLCTEAVHDQTSLLVLWFLHSGNRTVQWHKSFLLLLE